MSYFRDVIIFAMIFICFSVLSNLPKNSKTDYKKNFKTVSFENSEFFKNTKKTFSAKKYIRDASFDRENRLKTLSREDKLVAELKKNTEALNKIQNQLNSQRSGIQEQNRRLKQIQMNEHWKGVYRLGQWMMNM